MHIRYSKLKFSETEHDATKKKKKKIPKIYLVALIIVNAELIRSLELLTWDTYLCYFRSLNA